MIFNKLAREQSGSDTYNRFEFQTSYTFEKLIEIYKEKKSNKVIFCELHDDLIISKESTKFDEVNFFQVKTQDSGTFTFRKLFHIEPGKNHSFMGYVFYNFMHFPDNCKECYFITNQPINIKKSSDLKNWINSVHKKFDLKAVHPNTYNEIKSKIRNEFPNSICSNDQFEKTFEVFIKNTYFEKTNLDLTNHRKIVHSNFIELMEFKKHQLDTVQLLHESIRREIVQRANTKFDYIPSKETLLRKKSISCEVFENINNQIISEDVIFELFNHLNLNQIDIKALKTILKSHYQYMNLNPDDIRYIEEIEGIFNLYDEYISKHFNDLDSLTLQSKFKDLSGNIIINHPSISKKLLEALFYEKYFEKIS